MPLREPAHTEGRTHAREKLARRHLLEAAAHLPGQRRTAYRSVPFGAGEIRQNGTDALIFRIMGKGLPERNGGRAKAFRREDPAEGKKKKTEEKRTLLQ